MIENRQVFLAGLVREHLTELDELLADVLERGEPLSELEAQLLLSTATARLAPVEDELLRASRTPRSRARTSASKLRAWFSPRIGLLRHYPPKSLAVPVGYFRAEPPTPAPSISIVTPSFGQATYLERTLCSVLAQGYPALEYFVQDGGSLDGSREILQRYGDWLSGWSSEPDDGQADAINRGFARTSGEIMGWLNSDDLLLPGTLAYVARFFAMHPKIDVVYGNRLMIDGADGQIGAWILPGHDDHVLTLADYVPQETLFWRRRVWEASGGYVDTSFAYAMDWDLLLRFREVGARMAHVPRYLGAFRVHEEQKTTATQLVGFEEMDLIRERAHGRHVPVEEVLRRLRPYFVRHRIIHGWQRVLDRLPRETVPVVTAPAHLQPQLKPLRLERHPDQAPLLSVTDEQRLVRTEVTVTRGVRDETGSTRDSDEAH